MRFSFKIGFTWRGVEHTLLSIEFSSFDEEVEGNGTEKNM